MYLKNLFDARELAGGMMLKLMQDVNTMSLDKFQADQALDKPRGHNMNDQMPSWVEWEWDGRHPSCRCAIRGHLGT